MNLRQGLWMAVLGLLSLAAAGCGGNDDAPKCKEPDIEGSPFSFSGTATVHGSGTLPSGGNDGDELELLVNDGNGSYGVLGTDLLDVSYVCGRNFTFTISQMQAGTYRLDYEIYPPNADSPSAMGTSTNSFTVTDGANVEFDPTF